MKNKANLFTLFFVLISLQSLSSGIIDFNRFIAEKLYRRFKDNDNTITAFALGTASNFITFPLLNIAKNKLFNEYTDLLGAFHHEFNKGAQWGDFELFILNHGGKIFKYDMLISFAIATLVSLSTYGISKKIIDRI